MGENSSEKTRTGVRALGRAHDGDGMEDHEEVLMKRMISGHPLFELLIETHVNCLKVGLGEIEEVAKPASLDEANNNKFINTGSTLPTSLELDKFMEAYCMALNRLKEALEEPLKDATSFITNMYAQLNDLSVSENPELGEDQTRVFSNKHCQEPDQAI